MDKIFNYDFLKLEFKDIYEDLEELKEKTSSEDIQKGVNTVIDDIIYFIYKKNSILYDEKLGWPKRLDILNEINMIPNEILEKIILWSKKAEKQYKLDYSNDEELICMQLLYEIIVWFVVNYGEENYSLIIDNLLDSEKDVFKKYLPNNDTEAEKSLPIESNSKIDILQESEENASKLLEQGENYYFGRGVKRNNKTAYKYFLEAAKYKDEYAESYLGLFYDRGIGVTRNYEIAYQWYYKAAIKGNAFSQYSLGVLYSDGNGVMKDYTKAFIWFQKSAENDYVGAYYQLGRAYYNGLGVEKDVNKAFKWHKKAAENNFPASQYALSLMFKNGEGCEENAISAYYWIERAAENDYEDAYYVVGRSYLEGIYVDVDYKKAFYYLSKGYMSLDTNCIESLAEMYLKGLNVKKDTYAALELYNKAIEFGDKSLYFKVGKIYEEEGMIKQAIATYEEGNNQGNLKCTQRLGVMYYNGEGVKKNLEKAIEYMEVAAAKKEPHAMYVLAVAYFRLNKFGDKTSDIVKALLKDAYELKSPYAADYLACIMINELKEGKEVNRNELVRYIKFGVENELEESIFKYAYVYEKGIGVRLDYEKSYYYYNLAAEKNCIKAMVKIGNWYERGIFLKRNIDYAIDWYEKAASENDIEAVEKLIEIYEGGIGGRRSDIKAIYYVFKLIDLDALKGKEKLVYYCFKGIGVEENKAKGFEIIDEIEEIDKGTANYIRGYLAEEGLIESSKDEIIRLYEEGIDLGNLNCYGHLAMYLYKNKLNTTEKYAEVFKIAMEGRNLGVSKCDYVYIKEKLTETQKTNIVTVEELLLVKKLSKLINSGVYEVINDLIEWYDNRKPEDKIGYYELLEEAIYYNLKT